MELVWEVFFLKLIFFTNYDSTPRVSQFSRDRHCHGTRKFPRALPTDKLLRVAVPSQLGKFTRMAAPEELQESIEIMVMTILKGDQEEIAKVMFRCDTKLGACLFKEPT